MEIKAILTVIAGGVYLIAFVPYIFSIVRRETKPAKASWLIWASLDSITVAGMYSKNAVNGLIVGAVIGAWIIFILALIYGKPGWTKLDMVCLAGAGIGVALWLAFDAPMFGIVFSNAMMFAAATPTYEAAMKRPEDEDRLAWTIFWISCVIALFAIPALTFEDTVQPITFFLIETIMMYILYIRKRPIAVAAG